jgi:hypothetical protein
MSEFKGVAIRVTPAIPTEFKGVAIRFTPVTQSAFEGVAIRITPDISRKPEKIMRNR